MKKEFRNNVSAIILNKERKILMCEHIWITNAWQFPQGGVRDDEDEKKALLRELEEELGTNKFKILDEMNEKIKYVFPYYLREKYQSSGQNQKFFLVYFFGDDKEIIFTNQEKPEFKSFKWVDVDVPDKIVVYFKKISYNKALNYFREKIKQVELN